MRGRNLVTVFGFLFVGMVYFLFQDPDAEATQSSSAQQGTVFVPVNVTDSKGLPVTTLKAEHFQVLEDNKEQKITYVSTPADPMTLGVLLQLSASGPVKTAGQKDRTTVEILSAVDKVREVGGQGNPAMFAQLPLDSDAHYAMISRNLAELDKQAARRKALVVVSDGLISSGIKPDNMQPPKALIDAGMRNQFPIYFLFVVDKLPEPVLSENSNSVLGFTLQRIAEDSGGQVIIGMIENNLLSNAEKLRDSLKSQYVLEYTSTNTAKDGKWRKLAVKVNPPADLTKLKVASKARYFVPK